MSKGFKLISFIKTHPLEITVVWFAIVALGVLFQGHIFPFIIITVGVVYIASLHSKGAGINQFLRSKKLLPSKPKAELWIASIAIIIGLFIIPTSPQAVEESAQVAKDNPSALTASTGIVESKPSNLSKEDMLQVMGQSIKVFSPTSVSIENDKAQIVLNQNQITDTIYTSIVKSGLCAPLWIDGNHYLSPLSEVSILNKFKRQGYVLERPNKTCSEVGNSQGKQSSILLMGNTHLY